VNKITGTMTLRGRRVAVRFDEHAQAWIPQPDTDRKVFREQVGLDCPTTISREDSAALGRAVTRQ
jgi:hypothetical protein